MKHILRHTGIPLILLFLIRPASDEPLPSQPIAEAEPFSGGYLSSFADEEKTETDLQEDYPALFSEESEKAGNSEPLPRDLLFVIDNSGSMKKNDPAFITNRFITEFLDQLGPGDRCGMILFDSSARLVTPLTEMDQENRFLTLKKNLNQVNYKGQFTNSPAGIERAIYELNVSGRREASKSIVFLTDGIVDTGSKPADREKTKWLKEDLTDQCRHSGIRIFSIAFTEKADFNLIQSLAVRINGAYFRAQDATDVGAVFDSVLKHLEPAPLLQESVTEQTRAPRPLRRLSPNGLQRPSSPCSIDPGRSGIDAGYDPFGTCRTVGVSYPWFIPPVGKQTGC